MDKVWEIKDPGAYLKGKKAAPREARLPREEKDPAAAYSRSLLAWGLGQLYNDQLVKGALFMVLLLLAVFGTVLAVIYRQNLLDFLIARNISPASSFLVVEALLFLALLFWISNAADAYRRAALMRRTPFPGVTSRVTPLLGSLVVPGWGQFLNGQPIKGSIFSVLAIIGGFSVLSVLSTYLAWPLLDAGDARFLAEGIAATCLFLAPLAPLLWTVSAYDAFSVSRDELLKEPLGERMKAAYYRGRTQGWVQGVFPQIKGTFMLVLFLTFFLIVVHYWFPTGFYAGKLAAAQTLLRDRGMTIVPELIGKMLELMA